MLDSDISDRMIRDFAVVDKWIEDIEAGDLPAVLESTRQFTAAGDLRSLLIASLRRAGGHVPHQDPAQHDSIIRSFNNGHLPIWMEQLSTHTYKIFTFEKEANALLVELWANAHDVTMAAHDGVLLMTVRSNPSLQDYGDAS